MSLTILLIDFNHYTYNSKTFEQNNSENIFFSISAFDGKNESKPFMKSLGHAWVSISNQSGHSIKLNDYEICNNELLTISVWALTNHKGVAFNLEPEFINKCNRYNGYVSLTTSINEADLKIIENYIASYDDWTFNRNCSHWSLDLWNTVVNDDCKLKTQTMIYTPKRVKNSIEEFQNIEYDMDTSNAKNCFMYVNRTRTELTLCK